MAKWYGYLVKENIYGLGIQALGLAGGMAAALIFPNMMPQEQFGYYSLGMSVAIAWLLVADGGLNQVALKFIPEGETKGTARKYHSLILRNKALLASASLLILFALSDFIALNIFKAPIASDGIKVAALITLLWSFTTYFENVLFSLKGASHVFLSNIFYQIARIGGTVALYLYFFPGNWVPALAASAIASALYLGLLYWGVGKRMPQEGKRGEIDGNAFGEYWRFSFIGFFGSTLFMSLDPIVVGAALGPDQVAVYRVAGMWVSSFTALAAIAHRVFFSAHARESEERSRSIVFRGVKYAFAFSLLVVVLLALLSGKLLTLVYAGKYSAAYPVMALLGLLSLETALNAISAPVLLGKGKISLQTKILIATGALQLAAMLIITPIYGVVGCAFSVVFVRLIFSFVSLYFASSTVKVAIPLQYMAVPVLASVLSLWLFYPYVSAVHDVFGVLLLGAGITLLYSVIIFAARIITLKEILELANSMKN